ncbi:MAG: DUF2175 domain-containing protein [Thalassolituus sp.]|mgnify:FL=1|jgi:hypothetical protein|uniref:DUF2175 domain-containing protein n=1 Tax=Thalassolituus oleivorans MIL-1 TaxID=1298593 RepID=M5DMJ3_9GAMM|nr:hypothetical protein [Thalassolituus oleivorans]PCI49780.1 MAG: DUF2175 domain-containing protein [Oceanospirillales bacterium]PHQ87305.1 MAG: DUF2175 domain-containing protein [Thalassobium sp.]AHK17800.1 hypothetical protein R615_14055 [Thalassolituus oleivorans R6-15]APR68077.1 DUF2175 domain-containing protein [Thalassolituus oleivorans]MBQ0727795.1 DUF2175 domain-containing protein [Thalassolituus oleivorans]
MSLNCVFCNKLVFGTTGVTVPNQGPAHQYCYQAHVALKRTFQSLDISALNESEFNDLKDLVLSEANERERKRRGASDAGDIELF